MLWCPEQRFDGLVTTEAGDDLVVYDLHTHVVHTLTPVAYRVLQACDGQRGVEQIAVQLGLTVPDTELVLDKLTEANLLSNPVRRVETGSRRRFLRKGAGGAIALPVIISVSAPTAAAAASGICVPGTIGIEEPCPAGSSDCCRPGLMCMTYPEGSFCF
jgi:hypothetical protein